MKDRGGNYLLREIKDRDLTYKNLKGFTFIYRSIFKTMFFNLLDLYTVFPSGVFLVSLSKYHLLPS